MRSQTASRKNALCWHFGQAHRCCRFHCPGGRRSSIPTMFATTALLFMHATVCRLDRRPRTHVDAATRTPARRATALATTPSPPRSPETLTSATAATIPTTYAAIAPHPRRQLAAAHTYTSNHHHTHTQITAGSTTPRPLTPDRPPPPPPPCSNGVCGVACRGGATSAAASGEMQNLLTTTHAQQHTAWSQPACVGLAPAPRRSRISPASLGIGGVPFFVLRSSRSMATSSRRVCRSWSSKEDTLSFRSILPAKGCVVSTGLPTDAMALRAPRFGHGVSRFGKNLEERSSGRLWIAVISHRCIKPEAGKLTALGPGPLLTF